MKTLLSSLLLLVLSITVIAQQEPQTNYGQIKKIDGFKSAYVDARNIYIWLPSNYTPAKKYAVLYMHDGQMLFDSTTTWNKQEWMADETAARLIDDGKTKEFIIVGVSNNDKYRHSEYFPQKVAEALPSPLRDTLYQKALMGMPRSNNYLKFLVEELKPYIDKNFSTLPDRDNTFIAGSSMGGLISLYAICEYPKVFVGAACLSTHWIGNFDLYQDVIPKAFVTYVDKNLPDPKTHRLYFDHGDKTLDQFYKPHQLEIDKVLYKHQYNKSNLITLFFPGTNHSERAWQQRLHIPFSFLLAR